jgi:hypothetical protein
MNRFDIATDKKSEDKPERDFRPRKEDESFNDYITDATGVTYANRMLSDNFNIMCSTYIEAVCKAVINRYNRSVGSAELIKIAAEVLNSTQDFKFNHFSVSDVKRLSLSLLTGEKVNES